MRGSVGLHSRHTQRTRADTLTEDTRQQCGNNPCSACTVTVTAAHTCKQPEDTRQQCGNNPCSACTVTVTAAHACTRCVRSWVVQQGTRAIRTLTRCRRPTWSRVWHPTTQSPQRRGPSWRRAPPPRSQVAERFGRAPGLQTTVTSWRVACPGPWPHPSPPSQAAACQRSRTHA
jgi:hypothetical protein